MPLETDRLGRLEFWLWRFEKPALDWLGNRVSDVRYWIWLITGGWRV